MTASGTELALRSSWDTETRREELRGPREKTAVRLHGEERDPAGTPRPRRQPLGLRLAASGCEKMSACVCASHPWLLRQL